MLIFRQLLKEQGLADEVGSVVVDLYEKHCSTMTAVMKQTGIYVVFPIVQLRLLTVVDTGISSKHIVGINWRLDYSIRSKHGTLRTVP